MPRAYGPCKYSECAHKARTAGSARTPATYLALSWNCSPARYKDGKPASCMPGVVLLFICLSQWLRAPCAPTLPWCKPRSQPSWSVFAGFLGEVWGLRSSKRVGVRVDGCVFPQRVGIYDNPSSTGVSLNVSEPGRLKALAPTLSFGFDKHLSNSCSLDLQVWSEARKKTDS